VDMEIQPYYITPPKCSLRSSIRQLMGAFIYGGAFISAELGGYDRMGENCGNASNSQLIPMFLFTGLEDHRSKGNQLFYT
jgi:hypothetical protein